MEQKIKNGILNIPDPKYRYHEKLRNCDNIERCRLMSKSIKTRSRIQCQTYHKSKMDKYETLEIVSVQFNLMN